MHSSLVHALQKANSSLSYQDGRGTIAWLNRVQEDINALWKTLKKCSFQNPTTHPGLHKYGTSNS